jgi:energy-converting hydrogenase B subunit D
VTAVQLVALAVVAVGGTATVLTRDPFRQAIVGGVYAVALAALFVVFQAPEVALSEVVIGMVGLPAMILFALSRIREEDR